MTHKFKIGDIAYPAGCSRAVQLDNKITINHIKTTETKVDIEGKEATITTCIASENGRSWYPFQTLTPEPEPEPEGFKFSL